MKTSLVSPPLSTPLALVVDDEPDICELLEITLGRMHIETLSAHNLEEAKNKLSSLNIDLCLTDMRLPDGSGLELVAHCQEHYPQLPIAVITAHGNMEAAVQALKAGAFDFVSKPVNLNILRDMVNTALKVPHGTLSTAKAENQRLIGHSASMTALRAKIQKLARSQAPVHIYGASGTGKELVARAIHALGPRCDAPFTPVNCGAIPAELMESEFFGHTKGSFTGANKDKTGLFQTTHNGTLFLDEVADLPLHMQVKLLRAIQEKAIRPVGAQQEIPVDVRILSATHKHLHELVEQGLFRQDLFYRINVIELAVPSLKERAEDISLLTDYFLDKLAKDFGSPKPKLTPEAMQTLQDYAFPGNIRELENILERALTLCDSDEIDQHDLFMPQSTDGEKPSALESYEKSGTSLEHFLGSLEKEAIQKALQQSHGNKTAAARILGISFRALRYRLKKLGL